MAVLRVLAEHCSYGASLNDMLRDRIVCGINHDKIQQRLLAEKDLSCAKTLELANSIEAAEKGSRDIKNSQAATGSSSTVPMVALKAIDTHSNDIHLEETTRASPKATRRTIIRRQRSRKSFVIAVGESIWLQFASLKHLNVDTVTS